MYIHIHINTHTYINIYNKGMHIIYIGSLEKSDTSLHGKTLHDFSKNPQTQTQSVWCVCINSQLTRSSMGIWTQSPTQNLTPFTELLIHNQSMS